MTLVVESLERDIKDALATAFADEGDSNAAQAKLANALAIAIDKYIKSGTVTTTVNTVVTTSTGAGTGIGQGTGNIT